MHSARTRAADWVSVCVAQLQSVAPGDPITSNIVKSALVSACIPLSKCVGCMRPESMHRLTCRQMVEAKDIA